MKLRSVLPIGLCAVALSHPASAVQDAAAPKRPNVVFLIADDLGYGDATTFGGWIPTPHLDALAQQGARFTQAYATGSMDTQSRVGLFTGLHPARLGVQFEVGANIVARKHGKGLPTEVVTLFERLRALGYHTGLIGKWYLGLKDGMRPLDQGVDEFFGFLGEGHTYLPDNKDTKMMRGSTFEKELEPEYLTDAWVRESLAFLEKNKASPFFLSVSFNAPHLPYEATPEYLERFRKLKGEQQTYAAMISALDDAVGKILTSLEAQGLASNTLVFFLSDNGAHPEGSPGRNAPYSLGKGYLFEGGIRVPLVLRWPGSVGPGTSVARPVSLLDVALTTLKVAGADAATLAELDGQDLLAAEAPERTLLWQTSYNSAIRRGDWKLIVSKESRWLFHLSEDPGEKTDLLDQQTDLAAALTKELGEWTATNPKSLWRGTELPSPARVFQKPYWMNF